MNEEIEEEEVQEPKGKNDGWIAILLVVVVFGGYICWEIFKPSGSQPDCYYTNKGCQGENRWGQ